jgi:tetratricopeptide (TPR) repeat protein
MNAYRNLILCLAFLPSVVWSKPVTPPELAQQIIQAIQNGQAQFTPTRVATNLIILRNAQPVYPRDPAIPFALADCYLAQSNTPAGLQSLAQAYALAPNNPLYGVTYCVALKNNKQLLQADNVAKQLAAAHPDSPQIQILLATLDQTIQKYDEAINVLRPLMTKMGADSSPQDKGALLFLLGNCYLHLGKTVEAVKALEAANVLYPHAAAILCGLAEATLKNGEVAKARDYLDQAMAINPRIPAALYYKGILLERAGAPDKARQYFQACYQAGKESLPDNGEDYFRMAQVCAKLNRSDESHRYQAEAAKLLYTADAPWAVK